MYEALIFMDLFLPYIYGKRYYSSFLVCFIFFLLILKTKQPVNEIVKRLFILTIAELLSSYFSVLVGKNEYSIRELVLNSVSILIPLLSYYCGFRLIKVRGRKSSLDEVLFGLTLAECVVGISQLLFVPFRMVSLQLYSSVGKYSQTFSGGLIRIVGTLGNPNNYACLIAILSSLNLYLHFQSNKLAKKVMPIIFNMLLATIVIVFSQSKTALVIYLALISYVMLDSNNLKRVVLFLLILVPIIIILLKFSTIGGIFAEYLNVSDNMTLGGRKDIWLKYFEVFKSKNISNMLFGNGPSFFKSIDSSVDNAYLDVIIAYGVFGLALYFAKYFILILWSKNRCINKAKKVIIFGILILSITSQLDLISSIAYYLIFGALDSFADIKSAYFNSCEADSSQLAASGRSNL